MESRVGFTSNVHNPTLGQHMSSAHSPGRSKIRDYTYRPTYRRAAQRVRLTTNAHNPRNRQHMSSAHSPGRSMTRDYTYRPTYRAAQRLHNPRLDQHTSSAHSPGRSTIRDFTYRPMHRAAQPYHETKYIAGPNSEFDLRQTHKSLGSASIRRAHIVLTGVQSGTAHIDPPIGQHSRTTKQSIYRDRIPSSIYVKRTQPYARTANGERTYNLRQSNAEQV